MRKLTILFCLLSLAGSAGAVSCSNTSLGSGFTCVISHSGSGGSTSQSITFSGGHTGGNKLIIWAEANSSTAFSGTPSVNIANTLGYTWLIARGNCAAASQQTIAYYVVVPSTSGSSDTITVSNTGGSFMIVQGAELSNTGALDGSGGCGTSSASGTVTIGDLNIGNAVGSSGLTSGSGWTTQESTAFSVFETQIAASTTATATFTGSPAVSIVIAFFAPTSTVHTMPPRIS